MPFLSLFKRNNKVSLYDNEDSYKDILYESMEGSIREIIFNRTNLKCPKYVLHRSGVRLYYKRPISNSHYNKIKSKNMREFNYKNESEFIRNKSKSIRFCWDHNLDNCRARFSSYEEYFAINCKTMGKLRIKLVINE